MKEKFWRKNVFFVKLKILTPQCHAHCGVNFFSNFVIESLWTITSSLNEACGKCSPVHLKESLKKNFIFCILLFFSSSYLYFCVSLCLSFFLIIVFLVLPVCKLFISLLISIVLTSVKLYESSTPQDFQLATSVRI